MKTVAITIKTEEKTGVLNGIADKLYEKNYNILYTHLFLENNNGQIYMELGGVSDIDGLIDYVSLIPSVISVEFHKTLDEVFGKRVLVIGDGEIMAQAVQGGVMEAEKHNMRGERISVDGMVIGGGTEIKEAIFALTKLPRINALVLSGTMMGGKITEEISKLKKRDKDIIIVALQMPGDVDSETDLVMNDPRQAGAMAVKLISDINSYNNDILNLDFIS